MKLKRHDKKAFKATMTQTRTESLIESAEALTHASLLAEMLINSVSGREPDFIIGGPDDPYIKRWWLRRERESGSIYLHQIIRDDDDRALHDHPWDSTSIILQGRLREIIPGGERVLAPGSITSRKAEDAHRLELVDGPVWSLFITGPRVRDWGFHCPQGWRHWREFTDPATNGATAGKGCS